MSEPLHDDPGAQLGEDELERYRRHLVIPEVGIEGQERLKRARVLLVGLGGLGSPAALYLAAAGIGTLGLLDDDVVDRSNLQRQVLYGDRDVGRPKVEAAAERIAATNPHVALVPYGTRLTAANALAILAGWDVVVDGSDNFATRYLVNDACVRLGLPDVFGSILRFEGQLATFWAVNGPCYRCLFPEPPPPGAVPSCAEAGVLGVLPGIIGSLQASQAIQIALGRGEATVGRLLLFDALRLRFRELALKKNPECPVCSLPPDEVGLSDSGEACSLGAPRPVALPAAATGAAPPPPPAPVAPPSPVASRAALAEPEPLPFDIAPAELAARLATGEPLPLVDVRGPDEHALGTLAGARLLPLHLVPVRLDELAAAHGRDAEIVVYCHLGMRSAQAVHYLRRQGFRNARNLRGGIEAWRVEIDPTLPAY